MIVVIPSNSPVVVPPARHDDDKNTTLASFSSSYSDDTTSSVGGSSSSSSDNEQDYSDNNSNDDDQNNANQENIVCCSRDENNNTTVQRPRRRKRRRRPKRGGRKQRSQQHEAHEVNASIDDLTLVDPNMYVALDCEMVGVGYKGRTSSIARVSIVDWYGNTVLDVYVRQDRPVTDYRTQYSGISPSDIQDLSGALSLDECRCMVLSIIQDKILIGHGLKNDLRALGICHPWQMTRDTAKYEPFMKVRFDDGILWPRKLRDLVWERLKYDIQTPDKPHDPIEDAKGAFGLYKLVRTKFEKVMKYKIDKTKEIEMQQQ